MRLFTCDACGHRMRLAGAQCGACYADKRAWQRPVSYVVGLGTLLGLIAAVGVALV